MPSEKEYDPVVHLCFEDAKLDSHQSPSMLQVVIKCSKTDPLRLGVTLYIGALYIQLLPAGV